MMTERKTIYLDDALEAVRKLPNAGVHWFVSAEAVFDALLKLPSAESDVARDIATIIENEQDMRVLLREPKWIPCSDPSELPKNRSLWVTHCTYKYGFEYRYVGEAIYDMTEWSDDVSDVIAWMPRPVEPEPYTGDI